MLMSTFIVFFFHLSIVAPQMDDMLMKSMIRLVTLSLKTHKERSDVVVWGCKAVSQMSAHSMCFITASVVCMATN